MVGRRITLCRIGQGMRVVLGIPIGLGETCGCDESAMEGVRGFGRADDRGTRVLQNEHGKVVRIGVGDVDVLTVDVDRRRETA